MLKDIFSTDRMVGRRRVKERLAQNKLIDSRIDDLRHQVAEINLAIDNATIRHEVAVAPIQSRLAEIERETIGAMVAGQPVAESLAEEREELLATLADRNVQLETEAATDRARILVCEKEIAQLQATRDIEVLEFQLCKPPLVKPELLDERYVNERRVRFAESRCDAAKDQLTKVEALWETHHNPVPNQVATLESTLFNGTIRQSKPDSAELQRLRDHLRRAKLEFDAATRERAGALAESQAIYRKMVDE